MNKSAIQKYAIWARTEMIAQVEQRAYQYGITADGYGEENAMIAQGRALTNQEQEQRWELILQIKRKGFTQVMEEVAYTWFNRFIALRFMEVNNYLPTHIRVFSDAAGAFKPEILTNAMQIDLDGLDRAKVAQLIDANQTENLYRYLLLTQCNALNKALPKMFEKMGGYTEILLPNNILRADGILGRMVNEIPEEDWTDQVQIIGWLYQYYNSELKDDTFALLKKNVKITKERVPSATQLFTPDWIVRYMVENSLGRLWIDGHPNDALKSSWKYYLDEAEQEADVQAQLEKIRTEYANLKPQDIKVIDPCMGSGHILVYAFDVLVQIYKSYGISERDAARLILENNLYGLDIDDRAAQLAYFAVMMKARQYDRRILFRDVQPSVFAVQESNSINRRHLKFFGWQMSDLERNLALSQLNVILDEFIDAKEYGSILSISKQNWELLYRFVLSVDYHDQISVESIGVEETKKQLVDLIKMAAVMAEKYHVTVTNPPYMGSSGMSGKLSEYVKDAYPNSKNDLCTVFMEKTKEMLVEYGFQAMIVMESWMFLSSFEKLRRIISEDRTIINLVHMPYLGKGGTSLGINFGTSAFVMHAKQMPNYASQYEYTVYYECDENGVPYVFPTKNELWKTAKQDNFSKISGSPIAYWVSDRMYNVFTQGIPLDKFGPVRSGLQTSDNKRFLRLWFEVDYPNIAFDCTSHPESQGRQEKWYPHTKGGEFRKWFGNTDYVINWKHDGEELYAFASDLYGSPTRIIKSTELYFKPYITWSHTTSKKQFAARSIAPGMIFNVESPAMFPESHAAYFMGLLNSKPATSVFQAKNQTFHFLAGDAASMPVIFSPNDRISDLSTRCIEISKTDWDSFETSWGFRSHPLVHTRLPGLYSCSGKASAALISSLYNTWMMECDRRFNHLKASEEELNHIFIDIYGLNDELSPEVEEKDVTVRKADLGRDIRSLISYAVGCMFGRYSLDIPGLAYAGGEWDISKYRTIKPEKDNIIPICDDDYFDDDITNRFVKWVEIVYGNETLEDNLKFIADAIGGKGAAREVIRSYFINDFFADHCSTYSVTGSGKRPIYWLFDSGKKNGFKALIYMHRYQRDLLARMRTDYVHEMQERYRTQLNHLNDAIAHASTSERVKLNKQLKKIQDQALELQKYEEKIHHLADRNIFIDLDDGVKHNYALFGDVLAKIK